MKKIRNMRQNTTTSTCSDDSCFERMVTQIPQSTSQILQCMHNHQCQVANAYLTTHVMERNEYDE